MLDWLIIGGGIHGTHLSLVLRRRGVAAAALRVVDPWEHPLGAWEQRATSVGMPFLRSTEAHHIDLAVSSLHRFADAHRELPRTRRLCRPSRELFAAHARQVIATHDLGALRLRGRAQGLARRGDAWSIACDRGELRARRVILALGPAPPVWPAWARELRQGLEATPTPAGSIDHVFEDTYDPAATAAAARLVVVGGGLSAVQVAITAARARARPVTLVVRRPPTVADFDPDSCWGSERCLRRLWRLQDPAARRALIRRARRPGTIPSDVQRQLVGALRRGQVELHQATIVSARATTPRITLVTADQHTLAADRVVLATGLGDRRPGPWLDGSSAALELPETADGWPVIDRRLRWAPGLYVTGVLAEPELGPAAGNIVGARLAGRRLAKEAA